MEKAARDSPLQPLQPKWYTPLYGFTRSTIENRVGQIEPFERGENEVPPTLSRVISYTRQEVQWA